MTFGGVCGTDAHRLAGDLPVPPGPIALGHEAVGVVADIPREGASDSAGRPLQIGEVKGNDYIVKSGLKTGDKLIVSGIQKFAEGAPVKPE